jgi:alginate O-acetyltransferase complex protein AlgI
VIFASQVFLFWFLPVILIVYYAMPTRWRTAFLLAASVFFYGWWRPDFVALMMASTAFDYAIGAAIGRQSDPRRRKVLLAASCVANLGLLAWFKYANFGIDTLNAVLERLGTEPLPWARIVLPVGISFYTFQSLSYTIDVYRREVEPARSLVDFACFVSLFPQLVAGPIVRYRDLADQLRERTHGFEKFGAGALLFQIGLGKKILIADVLAPVADAAYAIEDPRFAEAWLGTIAYGFQIYFDFSGYSDMAIGLGLLLGFRFPVNFDAPYRSRSVTEFWRRWHVTLSTWLRDYLYVPLGGNRKGPRRTYAFLMITMLLGGLWHGAAWTFVSWGAYQGAWLVVERLAGKKPLYARAPAAIQVALTFAVAMGGWVFFRAPTVSRAMEILGAMAAPFGAGAAGVARLDVDRLELFVLLVSAVVTWCVRPSHELVRAVQPATALAAPCVFLAAIAHLFFQAYSPFLYFRF